MRAITAAVLLLGTLLAPAGAGAANVVIRSLGGPNGQYGVYGSVTLSKADDQGHAVDTSLLGAPVTDPSGLTYYLANSIPRQSLANAFGGGPEGHRLVITAADTYGFGFCLVEFASFGPGCTPAKNGSVNECSFFVPDLTTTDFEVSVTWKDSPGGFDPAKCQRTIIDGPPGGGGGGDPVCGDGVREGAEECDDGDTDPGDGCDASCRIEDLPPGSQVLEEFMDAWAVAVGNSLNDWFTDLFGTTVPPGQKRTFVLAAGLNGRLMATAVFTPSGAPRAAARSARARGAKVLAKGKRKFRSSDTQFVEFEMKLTKLGRRVLKQAAPFTATLDLRFKGADGEGARTESLTVPAAP